MKEKISKVVAGVVNTEDWKSILDSVFFISQVNAQESIINS